MAILPLRECLACGNWAAARDEFQKLIDRSIAAMDADACACAIDEVLEALGGASVPVENGPEFVFQLHRFYTHFGLYKEAVDALIWASDLYSRMGAFQPAYRALADAEIIARERKSIELLREVLIHGVVIAGTERDFHTVRRWGEKALDLFETDEVPLALAVNLATACMVLDDAPKAVELYQSALEVLDPRDLSYINVGINLSAAYRRCNRNDLALEWQGTIDQCIQQHEIVPHEVHVERHLIWAANFRSAGDLHSMTKNLVRAAVALDDLLAEPIKLHYRRAVRERYVSRLQGMMESLPNDVANEDLALLVAACAMNQAADWLHLLQWESDVQPLLNADQKIQLRGVIDSIAADGAPFLYGYREKYDDAFEPRMGAADYWSQLASVTAALVRDLNVRAPLATANATHGAELIRQRLSDGFAVIAYIASERPKLVYMQGIKNHTIDLSAKEQIDWMSTVSRAGRHEIAKKEFAESLEGYLESMRNLVAPITKKLLAVERGLIVLPSRWFNIPFTTLCLEDAALRDRMRTGSFEVRVAPILFKGSSLTGAIESRVGVCIQSEDLQFARCELARLCGDKAEILVDPTFEQFSSAASDADGIFVAQHSIPITIYADSYFASMSAEDRGSAFAFPLIQAKVHRWRHHLAFLNACHSGVAMARNAQSEFSTTESIGFATLFLLNRRAIVVGTKWGVLDRYALLLASLLNEQLEKSLEGCTAFSAAIANAVDLSVGRARSLLASPTESFSTKDLSDSTLAAMIKHPYCYGAYECFALV